MIMYVCVCARALFLYVGRHSSRGHLSFLNIVYVARVKHFRTFLREKHFTNELYLFNFDWFPLSFAEVDLLTFETSDVLLWNLHKRSHLCFFSQISRQLLDGFPWSEVNIFSPPSVWINIALLTAQLFLWNHHQINVPAWWKLWFMTKNLQKKYPDSTVFSKCVLLTN